MRYVSTRANGAAGRTSSSSSSDTSSFEDAVTSGYAPDGGLFVPEKLPRVTPSQLLSWSRLDYPGLATAVLRMFVCEEELPSVELSRLCRDAFRDFEDGKVVVPVKPLPSSSSSSSHNNNNNNNNNRVFVAELFHGPTFCFKDLAMRFVVGVLSYFCGKRSTDMCLLVSTTGDTGPAAVRAVSDCANPRLKILVHFPQGQISALQRRQLTTNTSDHVTVATFQGGGDDMDTPIKNLLRHHNPIRNTNTNTNNSQRMKLCGVNSYNIGRPLMQMVHHIWTYLRVIEQVGKIPGDADTPVDIIMPTGAMGNITGGYMAKKMGVPLGYLCSGVNANDITHRVVTTGKFHRSPRMTKTLSEAINIQVPYNFERILYYLTRSDDDNTNHDDDVPIGEWMEGMEETERLDLPPIWLDKLQTEFRSARVDDDEMCDTIRRVYEESGSASYLVDPHTAVAVAAAKQLGYLDSKNHTHANNPPLAILATASPCKFQESVTVAVGKERWEDYFFRSDACPESARVLQNLTEREPVLYEIDETVTLKENQLRWEQKAFDILTGMIQCDSV